MSARHAPVATWWLVAALTACGASEAPSPSPSPSTSPSPSPSTSTSPSPSPAPAPTPTPTPTPTPSSPPSSLSLQLVGVDRAHLLFLDTSRTPWERETIDASAIPGLHHAIFLGCGGRAAARTTREVAVFERAGALVARAPLPRLPHALGARLDAAMGPLAEEYGVTIDAETAAEAIEVGPLVRTTDGHLAMDPMLNLGALYGEEEGCRTPREDLRIELAVAGVEPAPCDAAVLDELPMRRLEGASVPAGWTCTFVSAAERVAPAWLTELGTILHGATSGEDVACESDATDPWERFGQCLPDSPGLVVCRAPDEATFVAGVAQGEAMGCASGPELFVVRGASVRARAGNGGHAYVAGDVWIYGGDRRWLIDAATRDAPLAFGRARPDAVLGRR